jgi:hypothetical protein
MALFNQYTTGGQDTQVLSILNQVASLPREKQELVKALIMSYIENTTTRR